MPVSSSAVPEESTVTESDAVEGAARRWTEADPTLPGAGDTEKGEETDAGTEAPELSGESIAYEGELRGKVYVAVRPENLLFSADGELYGTLEAQYYMGDVDDCRVRIGEALVRVITDGYAYKRMTAGQEVRLSVRDYIVYEDDGSLEETLEIRT